MFRAWTSPEAAFQIMKELSRDQPCDITGIEDYRMLDECGGVQWPLREKDEGGRMKGENGGQRSSDASVHDSSSSIPHPSSFQQRRLFADGRFFHADGKAKFIFEEPRDVPEPTDAEYPFTLLTGRGTSSQWHTQTRTAKSDVLRKLYPTAIYVEINPRDAEQLGIASNTLVSIASRRARITATAFVTPVVQPGQVFVPMHYAITNQLTYPCVDPYSRQPSYKACAVSVRPV
jgi:assimilatory nitrate reductase catalytic subunit